jgi:hypothetical protein
MDGDALMAATDTFHSLLGIFSGNRDGSAPASAAPSNGQVDMNFGSPAGTALGALSLVPGPVGWLGTLGSAGVRLGNASYADSARPTWGQQGLNFGQYAGSAFGLNSYGQGGRTDAIGQYNGSDVAPGGMASSGGFMGIGSSQHLAYTPAEAQSRYASQQAYGANFQGPWAGPGNAPATLAPTQAVAAPRPPMAVAAPAVNAFGVAAPQNTLASRINASGSSDPIGDLIRGLGLGGGGNYSAGHPGDGGPGGGYGGRADTGRSGADTGNRSSIN